MTKLYYCVNSIVFSIHSHFMLSEINFFLQGEASSQGLRPCQEKDKNIYSNIHLFLLFYSSEVVKKSSAFSLFTLQAACVVMSSNVTAGLRL